MRFREATKKRLSDFLDVTPALTAANVIDFAVEELFRELDAGGEIRITSEGLRLVRADPASLDQALEAHDARATAKRARKSS
jgi:hypothetical protein